MPGRVVVTGIGLVTSLGLGKDAVWTDLLSGRSGIREIQSIDTSRFKVNRASEVQDFQAADHFSKSDPGELGKASQFAVAAARMALDDADVSIADFPAERVGTCIGTTSGEPQIIEALDDRLLEGDLESVDPAFALRYPCQSLAANIASELELEGVNLVIPTACAAGNYAIALAHDTLALGRADLMIAGGADCFSRITYTGFARLGAIAPERCQPFDRDRQGMIPGEGAGILVLERADQALARGARIYAEILGYGLSCDAHHMTAAHPQGDGAVRAMQQALNTASLDPADVDYICAHGTGTPTNDRLETIAVKRVFGETGRAPPMSSIKSMLGHTMGAASAIEAGACSLAIKERMIPPTINLENADPDCDLDYVPNQAREHEVQIAMNNAYAFGGNNSSLLLGSFQE